MLQFESEIVLFELKSNLILIVFNRNTISLLNFESDLKGTTMTTITVSQVLLPSIICHQNPAHQLADNFKSKFLDQLFDNFEMLGFLIFTYV